MWGRRVRLAVVLTGILLCPRAEFGYSVQTHEQLIDLAWKPAIMPLLLDRYPGLTQAQLNQAHAYAYGGCAIQDIGYYPFGNQVFSNLTHYVRTGDFVQSLMRNAKTADELAFAVGAMSHYIGDTVGHSLATNIAVADEFPKLQARYGPSVSYDENPHAHVQVEFAFDVDQISKGRFAPSAYLAHVGLSVATDLLAKAFFETYGLTLDSILGNSRQRTTLRGYEFAVRHFLPRIAYAETVLRRRKMPTDVNDADFKVMEKALKQSDFENGWDAYRKKAGIGTYMLAGLIYVLPPIGPMALLRIKGPDGTAEQIYVKSVDASTARIAKVLAEARGGNGRLAADLPNLDLDTGQRTTAGTYRLADLTYADLLGRITRPGVAKIPSGLKADLEAFYADPNAKNAVKKHAAKWAEVQRELDILHAMATLPEP